MANVTNQIAGPVVLIAVMALGARGGAQSPPSVDTVRVSRAVLGRVLDDSSACRSSDAVRGMWSAPPSVVQAGASLVMNDGRVTVMDLDVGAVRVYGADGRELAKLGRRGAGPGEFGVRGQPVRWWGGDTIAVSDPDNSRIALFTGGRLASTVNLAAGGSLARTAPHGRDARGALLYWTGLTARTDLGSPFRAPYRLVLWQPTEAPSPMSVVREVILGAEMHIVPGPERPVFARANFARTTWFDGVPSGIVAYDDARPVITFMDWYGRTLRAVSLEVTDPPVSADERDSIARLVNATPSRVELPGLDAVRRLVPPTRSAATWHGVDSGDGFWLGFRAPVAAGRSVFVRFSADGAPTACYRASPGTKTMAFAPDRVVTVVEGDAGDVINVERTVAYPRGR